MRKQIVYISFLLIAAAFILFSSFQEKEGEKEVMSKQELMELKVKEKYDNYRRIQLAQCKEDGLDAALIYIDSLIRTPGFIFKNDTIKIPHPPSKPNKPNLNAEDYKKAKPIFE